MAVVIRLSRRGTRHRPVYHIVATDSRNKRDGSFIEQMGVYNPLGETQLAVDEEKAKKWIRVGARQTPGVKALFSRVGIAAK